MKPVTPTYLTFCVTQKRMSPNLQCCLKIIFTGVTTPPLVDFPYFMLRVYFKSSTFVSILRFSLGIYHNEHGFIKER